MSKVIRTVVRAHMALVKDRSGATAIEYGLIAAGIAVVIIGTVFALGGELDTAFQGVLTEIQNAGGAGGGE